jgi:GNAT superfamily N-acetyltransferase
MVVIKALDKDCFDDILALLLQRGEAPKDFYEWKYLRQEINFFPTGFIAYDGGKAVGCIGVINRVFIDKNGVNQPATWFADWYVSDEARGKGIGLALMKKVHDLSSFSFGIPGPKAAQIIAQKASYLLQENFKEIIIPCQPFFYGFRLYKEGLAKRVLRGVFHKLQMLGYSKASVQEIVNIDESFFDGLTFEKTGLKKDGVFLKWIYKMPLKKEGDRKWHQIITAVGWLIFFVEKDHRGLTRARVVCYENKSKQSDRLFILCTKQRLAQMGIVYLQAYMHLKPNEKGLKHYVKKVSQCCSFQINETFPISLGDMESRWRDFIMGNDR